MQRRKGRRKRVKACSCRLTRSVKAQYALTLFAAPSLPPHPLCSAAANQTDTTAGLAEAKRLLDAKLITDSEYETIKARVLANL